MWELSGVIRLSTSQLDQRSQLEDLLEVVPNWKNRHPDKVKHSSAHIATHSDSGAGVPPLSLLTSSISLIIAAGSLHACPGPLSRNAGGGEDGGGELGF